MLRAIASTSESSNGGLQRVRLTVASVGIISSGESPIRRNAPAMLVSVVLRCPSGIASPLVDSFAVFLLSPPFRIAFRVQPSHATKRASASSGISASEPAKNSSRHSAGLRAGTVPPPHPLSAACPAEYASMVPSRVSTSNPIETRG